MQDLQRFEKRAADAMAERLACERAASVLELGCGTGRLARQLLAGELPPVCRYTAVDVSDTMVAIATQRLSPYRPRAVVERIDGAFPLRYRSDAFDRFITTYVLDLLDEEQLRCALSEAARLLQPGGLLGIVSLTEGERPLERAIAAAWARVQRLSPRLVGGCRPIDPLPHLDSGLWHIRHAETVRSFAIPSAVVIAERRQEASGVRVGSERKSC